MQNLISAVFMIIGSAFMLAAAIGILRMPDLFTRMSMTTKSATGGVGFVLLATAIHFGADGNSGRDLATIAFVFLTAPIAAHMIGRAAYFDGVPLWGGTQIDELRDRYDHRRQVLVSKPPGRRVLDTTEMSSVRPEGPVPEKE